MRKRIALLVIGLLALGGTTFYLTRDAATESVEAPRSTQAVAEGVAPTPLAIPLQKPQTIQIKNSPLKSAVIAAGDYLVRQQLPNGELPYQVNILTNNRSYAPAEIRLVGGAGSLYTVCRVAGEMSYCEAGDRALQHYLENLVSDPKTFKGMCFYTNGGCPLGGAALVVDAIHRRWQATGDFRLGAHDLLGTSVELGYFIISMRKAEGGFYHSFDPHVGGAVDPNYFSASFPGLSLSALLQLYEMTGNDFWLEQAREVNAHMIAQPATEDHWHSYALSLLARLDKLATADQAYGRNVAETIIAGQVRTLNPVNVSVSSITKAEALAALAQAFYISNAEHEWLEREARTFITFVEVRQLPRETCNFELSDAALRHYGGGLFASCDDPSIRVDAVQHWVNAVTLYLEYQSMMDAK
jgi:hypothetical protein